MNPFTHYLDAEMQKAAWLPINEYTYECPGGGLQVELSPTDGAIRTRVLPQSSNRNVANTNVAWANVLSKAAHAMMLDALAEQERVESLNLSEQEAREQYEEAILNDGNADRQYRILCAVLRRLWGVS